MAGVKQRAGPDGAQLPASSSTARRSPRVRNGSVPAVAGALSARSRGRDRGAPPRTTRNRYVPGRTEGELDVEWLAVTVIGFVAATVLVIVLARGSTARWERETRAARARPRESAVRVGRAIIRTAAAAPRPTGSVRRPLTGRSAVLVARLTALPSGGRRRLEALRAAAHGTGARSGRLRHSRRRGGAEVSRDDRPRQPLDGAAGCPAPSGTGSGPRSRRGRPRTPR